MSKRQNEKDCPDCPGAWYGRVWFENLEEPDGPANWGLQSLGLCSRKVDSTTQHLVVSVLNDYFPQTPQCLSQQEKHFFVNEAEVTVDLSARSATECIKHAEASETQGVSGGLSTFFGVFFFIGTVTIYLQYIFNSSIHPQYF